MHCISFSPSLLPLQGTDFTYENTTSQLFLLPSLLTGKRKLSSASQQQKTSDETSTVDMFCCLWLVFWLGPHSKDLQNKTQTLLLSFCKINIDLLYNYQLKLGVIVNLSILVLLRYLSFSTDSKITLFGNLSTKAFYFIKLKKPKL